MESAMKKTLYLFYAFLLLPLLAWATHNRSGEMTYRQIGPNTIELTITTYTKVSPPSNQADRSSLNVRWGDGSAEETIQRISNNMVYNDIQRNIYIATHSYPGANPVPGQPYVVSMADPNRNDGILNINGGNSISVQFYLQTEVFLFNPSFFGYNSSPILLEPPVDFGVVGQVFQHTPNGYDPDGDSVAYELIVPMRDRNSNVPGYQAVDLINPGANNSFTFDENTGLFTWDAPQRAGEYNIAILVKSFRNGIYLGGIVRDIQIKIENATNQPPELEVVADLCVEAGKLIDFEVRAWDDDIPLQIVTLTATGGPFLVANSPATFSSVSGTAPSGFPLRSRFRWQTTCDHIQRQEWQLVFKAKDTYQVGNNDASLATFKVVRIKVVAPQPQNLQANVSGNTATLTWDAPYPCENSDNYFGFSVWRKQGCDNTKLDTCEVGVAQLGYVRINPTFVRTSSGGSYTYVDNTIQTGVTYSYRVQGEFATPIYFNGNITNFHSPVPGRGSEEVCIETQEDLPTIINVDVLETEPLNGEIFVRWVKPLAGELDTLQNPPPYRYELYESTNQQGNNFGATPIFTSPNYTGFYLANDTTFTSTGLNTEGSPYSYKVVFYAGGDTLGETRIASSIYLQVASSDELNVLTWTENVPWTNTAYEVAQEVPTGSRNFVILDTVLTQRYRHEGLTNGQLYCYRIRSFGSYNTYHTPDTLYNRSQVACGTPLDTIAPCSPDTSAIVAIASCKLNPDDDANNPERLPCQGTITDPDFLFNEIRWTSQLGECGEDVARFKVYFAPFCNGNYTLIYESQGLQDTVFRHQPSANNLAGCYYITAIDSVEVNGGGNEGTPSSPIRTDNCPFYDLPNTFTPNGDGANDLFKPCLIYRYIKSVNFTVTNRWGQVVFQTEDPAINWDGTDQNTGQPLPEGVYYYTCSVEQNCFSCDGVEPFKGFIHLIRAER